MRRTDFTWSLIFLWGNLQVQHQISMEIWRMRNKFPSCSHTQHAQCMRNSVSGNFFFENGSTFKILHCSERKENKRLYKNLIFDICKELPKQEKRLKENCKY
jgi:hypothetical protein